MRTDKNKADDIANRTSEKTASRTKVPGSQGDDSQKGFTLLECIICLIIVEIIGSMLIPYMGKGLTGSAAAVNYSKDHSTLIQTMETINAVYQDYTLNNKDKSLEAFKTKVDTYINMSSCSGVTRFTNISQNTFKENPSDPSNVILKVILDLNGQKLVSLFTN